LNQEEIPVRNKIFAPKEILLYPTIEKEYDFTLIDTRVMNIEIKNT